LRLLIASISALLAVLGVGCGTVDGRLVASPRCDRYASPSGSDSAQGTIKHPVRALGSLDRRLSPGQTGCLEAGHYGGIGSRYILDRSGHPGARIKLMAAPSQKVTVTGLIMLNGAYITLSGLNIDGSNTAYDQERPGTSCPYPVSNGLEINGAHDIFEHNDYYQSIPQLRGNGIGVGWNGEANYTIIRYNSIHDVGQCLAYDHLIYLSHGRHVQIYGNRLSNDKHGWGVQLYPDATDAHVYDNLISHAGSGFVIGGGPQVANDTINHNVVIDSTGLPAAGISRGVGISSCCGVGPGNRFVDNDVYHNPGGISAQHTSVTLRGNTAAKPRRLRGFLRSR
jgi:hypothetical protein